MYTHNVTAAAGVGVALATAVSVVVDGPVVLGTVDPAFATAAATAAAVWNTYAAGPYVPTTFNIEAYTGFTGNTVGSVGIPCHGAVCTVKIDPAYTAPVNVLIHEFGHGLGLPEGAVSGTGMTVDSGNHWNPQKIDPHEIMTETISQTPRLARFTVNAILPNNHACDAGGCSHHHRCVYTFGATAPGVCWPRGHVIVESDDELNGGALLIAAILSTLFIAVACTLAF